MMAEAPLRHDAAAPADDAGHARGGHGDEAQEHAGVDGEVIHALLGLLDEGVAEDLPREVLGFAVHFLQRLVDGHGADGHGGIAQDPLAGGVDVFARAEVHDGVGAPLGGPAHFFHLLLDRRSDGAVADVGVDLHEEIAPDDHRLELGVIDVRGDDGAPGGDFFADELGGDLRGDALREAAENARRVFVLELRGADVLLVEVVAADVLRKLGDLRAAEVFADGDVFHLRRDDALPRIPKLRDRMPRARAKRAAALAFQPGKFDEPIALGLAGVFSVFAAEVAVVLREHLAAVVGFHIRAGSDPRGARRGQTFIGGAGESRIAPRPRAVIDAHRSIFLQRSAEGLRRRKSDLAERHPNLRIKLTRHIHPRAGGELVGAVGFDGVFGRDHRKRKSRARRRRHG